MSKKKSQKKHHFVHHDPGKEIAEQIAEKPSGTKIAPTKKDTGGYTTKTISTDLKRTVITIGIFIVILIIIYIIQTKTGLINPFLKKFGL